MIMDMHSLFFISLGCDKNTVDSEIMLSKLLDNGFDLIKDESKAECIIVNTCCFIESAQTEAIDNILEMAQYKTAGLCRYLVVTGCLAQRFQDEILKEMPEVDAVVGTGSYEAILDVMDRLFSGERHFVVAGPMEERPLCYQKRFMTTVGYSSFIKIAEGCDNHCTYCVIPKIRGRFRSRPMGAILEEARVLAEEGVKELILVAQDTARYGSDLEGASLPLLLRELAKIEGIHWLRLLYCYPEWVTPDLIREFKTNPKLLHYMDMPMQHSEDRVLKRMGRPNTRKELLDLIRHIRAEVPDMALRTTFISGFPGETLEEHEALKDFIETAGFSRLGVFPYSQEDQTPAARLPEQIDEEEKERRAAELNDLARSLSEEESGRFIGSNLEVLIVGRLPDEENVYVARSYRDAPEIDGMVFVSSPYDLNSGDFVSVKVTNVYEYDLIAEVIQ